MMTTVWSGLSDGGLYAVVAIVMTIPLVRAGDFNFAQPMYIVLGEYLVVDMLRSGWTLVPMLLLLLALGAILGGVQEVVLQRPTRGHDTSLVTMLGMFVALQGFILAKWGSDPESATFFGGSNSINILGGVIQPVNLWIIGLALAGATGFQFAMRKTRWGVLGRAAMTDETASKLRGINVPRLRTTAFVVSGALSCALSVWVAPMTGVSTVNALHLVVFAFAAMAIGGFGSFGGAAAGGVIVGLSEAFASRYLSVDWAEILIFAMLCSVLVIRPGGLFGSRQLRMV